MGPTQECPECGEKAGVLFVHGGRRRCVVCLEAEHDRHILKGFWLGVAVGMSLGGSGIFVGLWIRYCLGW